jgi:hypothetical protein
MAIIPGEEKVFMVSKNANTGYSGSAALKAASEWYTMNDVSNTIRPYKVYTALLTQGGGDDPTTINSGDLIVGRTYKIVDIGDPFGDWTNVGAPDNINDTYFVATGTTPNSWGDGGMLGYNTGAPVATVLENTIGNIWFTYNGFGIYSINSGALFTIDKTTFSMGILDNNIGIPVVSTDHYANDANTYQFITSIVDGAGGTNNELLYNTPIEIRVYS